MITPEANAVWAGTGAIVSPHKGVETICLSERAGHPRGGVPRQRREIRFDGADLLPAGIAGEGLGALLQRAIRGDTIDWADFQTRVKTAWDAE